MSRKGGYKIIDLKGLDFSSNKVIDGIYESIKDNYGKPLLFSGIVIDGVEKDDVFTNAVVNGDGYDVTLYGQTIHISNVDVVSKAIKKLVIINEEINNKPNFFKELSKGVYLVKIGSSNIEETTFYLNKPLLLLKEDLYSAVSQPSDVVDEPNFSFNNNIPPFVMVIVEEDYFIINSFYEL